MNKYMEIANDLAKENLKTNDGGPFGACIVKDDKIIGKGNNKVLKNNDPTALLNMLSRLVITFLPRSKHLLISWLQSPSTVILEPRKKSDTVSTVSPSISHEVMGLDPTILIF